MQQSAAIVQRTMMMWSYTRMGGPQLRLFASINLFYAASFEPVRSDSVWTWAGRFVPYYRNRYYHRRLFVRFVIDDASPIFRLSAGLIRIQRVVCRPAVVQTAGKSNSNLPSRLAVQRAFLAPPAGHNGVKCEVSIIILCFYTRVGESAFLIASLSRRTQNWYYPMITLKEGDGLSLLGQRTASSAKSKVNVDLSTRFNLYDVKTEYCGWLSTS